MEKSNRIAVANYRARKLGLPATLTLEQWQSILSSRNACSYCGGLPQEIEHIVALSNPDSPGTVASNITVACAICNKKKGSETWNIDPAQLTFFTNST